MSSTTEHLVYIYGIVPVSAPDAPSALTGVEDSAVRIHRIGPIGALVSEVPSSVYHDEVLNSRLDDLAWVGERGMAHERVLDWYAERGPVIPLSLFSLHRDLDRVTARVGNEAMAFERILQRLEGRKEWGVKVWRRDSVARDGIQRLSPALQAMAAEIEAAPPGRRFLLERKRENLRSEEMRVLSKRVAHDVLCALREVADGAVAIPLPGNPPSGERVLLLHGAFLVADGQFAGFQRVVNELAGRFTDSGFELEFTGPWPPYHFTGETADDE